MKRIVLGFVLCLFLTGTALGVTWTYDWSSSDDGSSFGGSDIQNIQSDVDSQVATLSGNNAMTGNNTFSGTTTFTGTVSGLNVSGKHYRRGLTIKSGTTADEDIVVCPGAVNIGGTSYASTADSSDLDVGSETFLAGATGTDQYIYVYAYASGSTLAFKLSTEAPDLSYTDDTTAEFPLRYQLYSGTYYRCVAGVYQDAAGDLCWGQANSEGLFVTQFDASNTCVIGGLGDGADQTFNTIWTPKHITVYYGSADATPATTENMQIFHVTQQMLDTNWYATQLNVFERSVGDGGGHQWISPAQAGTINAITAQSAGTAGSFTLDAMTDNHYFYVIAYTDGFQE